MVKPIRTIILDQYLWKFIVRILIVFAVAVLYITNQDIITDFLTQPVFHSLVDRRLWPLVALWGILMIMMATHFIPPKIFTMALLKRKKEKLDMDGSFDKGKLLEYVQDQNLRAWHVMFVWVLLNGIVGMLYLFGILKVADLFMVSVFYFLCDYVSQAAPLGADGYCGILGLDCSEVNSPLSNRLVTMAFMTERSTFATV